jgi:hypothetical protein
MNEEVKLKKREMDLLERCWLAETCGQLPAQIGTSKAVKRLESGGYIDPMILMLPGRFAVTVGGHRLTKLGRLKITVTD